MLKLIQKITGAHYSEPAISSSSLNSKDQELDNHVELIFKDPDIDLEYSTVLNILNNKIFETKNKATYVVNIDKFDLLDIKPYRHQRNPNYDHIFVLEDGIKKTGYLYHPIILCHIPYRSEISIIDGQHRWSA